MHSTELMVEVLFLCLIGCLILIGNALVILAFIKGSRRMRTRTNYFVINLAISDLMVGCSSLPFWISVRLGYVDPEHQLYKALLSLDVLFGTTSIFCLAAISLERMFAVRYPAIHHNLNDKPFYISIAITWFLGITITAVKFLFDHHKKDKEYTVLILVLGFLLPLTIIVGCYAVIFYTAHTMHKATNQDRNMSRDIQVAKTISVIIGLFVVCWSPFFTINMVYYFGDPGTRSMLLGMFWIVHLTKALHYSNSMMNFLVYAVRSPDFRRAFKLLLCSCCNDTPIQERLRAFSIAHLKLNNSLKVNQLIKKGHSSNGSTSLLPSTTVSDYSLVTMTTSCSSSLINSGSTSTEPSPEAEDNVFK